MGMLQVAVMIVCLVVVAGCGGKCDPPCFAKCDGNYLVSEKCVENRCVAAERVNCGAPCTLQFMQVHGKMITDESGQFAMGGTCAGVDSGGVGSGGGAGNAI